MDRKALEERAGELELKFPANIGDEKLAKRIAEAEAAREQTSPNDASNAPSQQAGDGSAPADNTDAEKDGDDASTENGSEAQAGGLVPPADGPKPGDRFVEVIGPKQGRWRIGRKFTRQPTLIPEQELSEDDFAALTGDPELTLRPFIQPDEG